MKIYAVGGQVRDDLMGVSSKDRDYVVVGSTHEEMTALGFERVGSSFPVYLSPGTKEEYALARTERSTGPGHHDFEVVFGPDVTLEEDLSRRDLTINAIAKDLESGEIIDPFGGVHDIEEGVLRHVLDTSFMEDPLRTYRLLRFFARYGGKFTIDPTTLGLAKAAVPNLSSLPRERKIAEIMKCFEDFSPDNRPSLMIDLLCNFGEMPEVNNLRGIPQPKEHHPEGDAFVHTMLCLDYSHGMRSPGDVKWSVLCHDLGKVCYLEFGNLNGHEEYGIPYVENISDRFAVPNNWRKLALMVCENHTRLHRIRDMSAKKVYDLIRTINADRDRDFGLKFIESCVCDARGRGFEKMFDTYDQPKILWAGVAELNKFKSEISELSKKLAERHKGKPNLISSSIRSLKISYVRRALEMEKAKINN